MNKDRYAESEPLSLPRSVFKLYQHTIFDPKQYSGIALDDACPEFMFLNQSGVRLEINGHPSILLPRCFSISRVSGPLRFVYKRTIDMFSIKLQPWVARHFFPDAQVDTVVDLTERFKDFEAFRIELFDSSSFSGAVERTERFLGTLHMPDPREISLPMAICKRIYDSDGMATVKDLVEEFSHSRQKLNREFLFYTKYSIKEFAAIVRIRTALKFREENPGTTLTELAYQFGYFDQSHFIRDIKRRANLTPGQLFAPKDFLREQLIAAP